MLIFRQNVWRVFLSLIIKFNTIKSHISYMNALEIISRFQLSWAISLSCFKWGIFQVINHKFSLFFRSISLLRRYQPFPHLHHSPGFPQTVILRCNIIKLTKLSSLLATIDANRRSPARSEIRKMYSGAFTWLLRWVRPAITGALLKAVLKCPVLWDVTLCCLVCSSWYFEGSQCLHLLSQVDLSSFYLAYIIEQEENMTLQKIAKYSAAE